MKHRLAVTALRLIFAAMLVSIPGVACTAGVVVTPRIEDYGSSSGTRMVQDREVCWAETEKRNPGSSLEYTDAMRGTLDIMLRQFGECLERAGYKVSYRKVNESADIVKAQIAKSTSATIEQVAEDKLKCRQVAERENLAPAISLVFGPKQSLLANAKAFEFSSYIGSIGSVREKSYGKCLESRGYAINYVPLQRSGSVYTNYGTTQRRFKEEYAADYSACSTSIQQRNVQPTAAGFDDAMRTCMDGHGYFELGRAERGDDVAMSAKYRFDETYCESKTGETSDAGRSNARHDAFRQCMASRGYATSGGP